MIAVNAIYRGRSFTVYCVDLREALDLCAALRVAGGRVVYIDAAVDNVSVAA